MLIEPIIWRRAVREYSDEPILDQAIESLVKAAQFAPTAHNNRGVEFIVIKKQKIKGELHKILEQDFIKKAPVLLLLASDTKKSILPVSDIALATGFVMIQAAAIGLGTVWKHIDENQKEKVRAVLGIPADYEFINIIPVGYPAADLPDHSDAEFDPQKIHLDQW